MKKVKQHRIPDPELASGEGSPKRKKTVSVGDPSVPSGIRRGEIVAYPTESFYAFGADATNATAIRKVFRAKHREKKSPVALICGDLKQVEKYFFITPVEKRLAKKYWPGSLTILLRPKKGIAADALFPTTPVRSFDRTTPPHERRGPARIGVRVPAHAGARRLAARAGAPLTATSANLSGQPPTKSIALLKNHFPDILIMSGRCGRQRRPSTVINVIKSQIQIIRPGALHVTHLQS